MSKYTYSHHEERGEFTASVMDEMGNIIWSVKYPEYFEDDETGELIEASTIFDDGFMKNPNDLSGLYNYLLDLGLIADDDEIVRMSGYADGGAIPEGYHMMPDGTIMPDSAHMARGGTLETKIKKRLGKNFELPIEMAVYVPSTESANRTISKREFQARVDEVQEFVAKTFGGFSASEVEGGYVSDEKGLIQEDVVKVTAFSQIQDFENKFDILVEKIRFWADKWGQESIGFEFEGDLFYIDKNAKFNLGGEVDDDVDEHVEKLVEETGVPEEVWYEYASDMGMDVLDVTSDPYFGTYVSEIGFAVDMVSNSMVRNIQSYLEVKENEAFSIAEDMAIEHVSHMTDEEILKGTDYEDEMRKSTEITEKIQELADEIEEKIEELKEHKEQNLRVNATEEEAENYDIKSISLEKEIEELENESRRISINSIGRRRNKYIINDAKEQKISELTDEIYERIIDNPIDFFVYELGYDKNDLPSNSNFQINYQSIADDFLHYYHVVEHEDRIYVFRNYKRGGEMPEEPKKALRGYYFPEDMYEVYVSAESPTKEKKYLKSVISARSFEQAEDLTLSKLERKYPDYKFEITDVELVEGVMADGGQTRFNYDDPYVTAKLNIEGNYVDILTWIPKGDEEKTAESLESLNSKFQDKKLIVLDVNDYPDPEYKFWDSMLDKGLIFGFTDEYDRLHVRNATMKDGGKINYEGYYYGGGRMSETQRCDYGAMIQAAAYKRPIGEHFSKYIQDLRNEALETEHRTFYFDGKYYPAKKYEDYIFAVKSLFNDLRDENGKLKKDADLVEYYVTAYFDDEDIKKYSAKELYEMWIDGKAQNVEKKKKGWFFKDGGGIKDAEALKSYMPKIDTSKKRLDEITNSNRVEVATKIDELAQMVETAKGRGEKPKFFDLCQISVPNTNIYCQDNLGIDRNEMPQFKGKARPNSLADKLPKDSRSGSVDTEDFFKLMLSTKGIAINSGADGEGIEIDPSVLKATQRNMVGDKVVEMYEVLQKDPNHPYLTAPIFVSNDGYVLDGHHRWAAIVSYNVQNPESNIPMKVRVIDMPITELVTLANEFSDSIGIEKKPASVGTMARGGKVTDSVREYMDKNFEYLDGKKLDRNDILNLMRMKDVFVRVSSTNGTKYEIEQKFEDEWNYKVDRSRIDGRTIKRMIDDETLDYVGIDGGWIYKLNKDKFAKGGKVTFDDKVEAIAKSNLERKYVPKAVQKDYGKTFNREEAYDSARRIAGSMRKKEMNMKNGGSYMAKGGKIKNSYTTFRDTKDWGKSKSIWNAWTKGQRLHFLNDHFRDRQKSIFEGLVKISKKYTWSSLIQMSWNELVKNDEDAAEKIYYKLDEHIQDGQYADGGEVKFDIDDKKEGFVKYIVVNRDILLRHYDEIMRWTDEGKKSYQYNDLLNAIKSFDDEIEDTPYPKLKRLLFNYHVGELDDIAENIRDYKENGNMAKGGVVEYVLYGTKVGKKDWEEEILAVKPFEFEITPKLLALTKRDGYDRLRVAKIDLSTPPDFRKTIKKADGGETQKKNVGGFIAGVALGAIGANYLAKNKKEVKSDKKEEEEIELTWREEIKQYIDKEDFDYAINEFSGEIEDKKFKDLKKDYIEASDNLKNYLEKNDVLDEDEDIYVSETIDREGFDYALKGYNDWSGVKDKKYQSLYKEYLKSREKLENYINKYASGGETKWIQSAIKEKGALRETAKRKGLIKGKQKLSLADLKKLEKGSKKTAKRAKLAETLKKLKK